MDKELLLIANQLYKIHKKTWESWPYEDIKKIWKDERGNICVKYKNGTWFHYSRKNGHLEWW